MNSSVRNEVMGGAPARSSSHSRTGRRGGPRPTSQGSGRRVLCIGFNPDQLNSRARATLAAVLPGGNIQLVSFRGATGEFAAVVTRAGYRRPHQTTPNSLNFNLGRDGKLTPQP